MPDPRVTKLAQIMVHYSLKLQPGQKCWVTTHPLADEFNLAFYEEAVKAGAYVLLLPATPGADEIFYKYAPDSLLDFLPPLSKLIIETFDARLAVRSEHNSRSLSGIDPKRLTRTSKAFAPLMKTFMERSATGDLHWCVTAYPTHSMAQDADMSLADYTEFVYGAGMLNEKDPIEFWKNEGRKQQKLVDWLKGRDKVVLKGSNIDLKFSIKDRIFIPCDGQVNFPDGEIFTGPVENTPEGWVRFRYPAIDFGQEVTDIQIWFENGKAVKESATKNQELLTARLNTDGGSRHIGEFGIGTNYGITRFTKNMLFDEKMGGTIHLAMGAGYPETNSKNVSAIHWDMLCDMNDAEITVDGDLFYNNGKPVI